MFGQVLSDGSRRAQYDAARSTLQSPRATGGNGDDSSSCGAPFGAAESEDAFEAAFQKWWERAGAQ